MGIRLFDNEEEDGQLSMFDLEEDAEKLRTASAEAVFEEKEFPAQGSAGIRISRCGSCGKLLFVRQEGGCWHAVCNACDISYVQKA